MVSEPRRIHFVYYCSGHGYGHATRVSAFARHLLQLSPKPIVHIVSSAPRHVFFDSIAQGALYRCAEIDPVIVQPVAYRVDRQKSVDVLKAFLKNRDSKIAQERDWLHIVRADCVLSDAAFLGCCAAHAAGIPSILITNFSFDSVFSYLSTSFVDQDDEASLADPALLHVTAQQKDFLEPDTPISHEVLQPMVDAILAGYRCANLLVRLPGAIPIPSFSKTPSLPSPQWVDLENRSFCKDIITHLVNSPSTYDTHPHVPFPSEFAMKASPRSVLQAPLLVRSPDPSIYTPEGRCHLLGSIGVPSKYQDNKDTKLLLVSFGGQIFHRPSSHPHSRSSSSVTTPALTSPANSQPGIETTGANTRPTCHPHCPHDRTPLSPEFQAEALSQALQSTLASPSSPLPHQSPQPEESCTLSRMSSKRSGHPRQSQLLIAGAPPVAIANSPSLPTAPIFKAITTPPSPLVPQTADGGDLLVPANKGIGIEIEESIPLMVPDDSWIAIVCGVSKDWGRENGEELPENFFLAPKDVYMPDLTALADVLLGKLGYGTVSECVDACTPFVFVPRPLFIEEYGLRLLLNQEGVGVELSRSSYEAGEWADAIQEAYEKGKGAKMRKRLEGETGKRKKEGRMLAKQVVEWVEEWQKGEKNLGMQVRG